MSPERSLRTRKKQRTWDAIASGAMRLFNEKGFAATTLEQIAEAADVHKQTVLRYFKSKEDIALAYQTRRLEAFEVGLLDPQRRESVMEYWRNHVQRSAQSLIARGGVETHKFIDTDPRLLAHAVAIERQYQTLISEALSREAGVDPSLDVYSIALSALLVGGNYQIARNISRQAAPVNVEQAVLAVVDFAIRNFPPRESVAL
jgi:AcrR family transcriptional regulator